MSPANRFPNNIAAYRKHKGLSQRAASEALGLNRARMSLLESGRELPTWETVKELMALCEASLPELYPNPAVRDLITAA